MHGLLSDRRTPSTCADFEGFGWPSVPDYGSDQFFITARPFTFDSGYPIPTLDTPLAAKHSDDHVGLPLQKVGIYTCVICPDWRTASLSQPDMQRIDAFLTYYSPHPRPPPCPPPHTLS